MGVSSANANQGKSIKKKQGMTANERRKVESKPNPFTSTPLEFKTGGGSGSGTPNPEGAASAAAKVEPPGVNQQPTFTVQPQAPISHTPSVPQLTRTTSTSSTIPTTSSVTPPAVTSSTAPAASAPATQHSSVPQLPPDLRVPIVVGPLPASYSSPPSVPPAPIVLHDNALFLNPAIFSSLSAEQLKALEALGAAKALEILQGYIRRYLDEKRRAAGKGGRGRGKKMRGGLPSRGGAPGAGPPPTLGHGQNGTSQSPETGNVSASATTPVAPAPVSGEVQAPAQASGGGGQRAPSPVIVIDDDDDEPPPAAAEGPALKKRRVDGHT
jgi:forkhead box protein K